MNLNLKRWLVMLTGCTTLIAVLGLALQPSSADEYEWDSTYGYHEEEWYDPSDWFDPDDGIDYESDYYGGYYDNDVYDGDETWYGDNYYTDDWYDDEPDFDNWYDDKNEYESAAVEEYNES